MADQDHPVQAEGVEPGVQVAGVVGEPVSDAGLARGAHPDQVRRQAASLARDISEEGSARRHVAETAVAAMEYHVTVVVGRALSHDGAISTNRE
jgi:hypothetical protein